MEGRLMSTRTKMKNYKQMNTTYSQNMGYNAGSCYEYIPHLSRNTIVYASIDHKPYKLCHRYKNFCKQKYFGKYCTRF